jgi:glycerate kinase
MGGCAGGLSGGLMGAFGARLRPGAAFVLDQVGFERRLAAADAVISGEGRLDEQSLRGKLVGAVAERCAATATPLHAVVGSHSADLALETKLGLASIQTAPTLATMADAGRQIAGAE